MTIAIIRHNFIIRYSLTWRHDKYVIHTVDPRYLEYSVSRTFWYLEQMSWSFGHLLFTKDKQLLTISNLVISNFSLSWTDFKGAWKISPRYLELYEKN